MIRDGWLAWAIKEPGPPERSANFGNAHTAMTDIICHSMEGWHKPNGYRVFTDPDRFPTAWHGTVGKDGALYQHYDIRLRLQHAHNGNVLGPGFEAEGFKGEPLTPAQRETYKRIFKDISEFMGREYVRDPDATFQIVEHNEVSGRNIFGFKKTQCPSGRYDKLWEEMTMMEDARQRIEALEAQVTGLNRYQRAREQLRNLASATDEQGELLMLRAVQILRDKGILDG